MWRENWWVWLSSVGVEYSVYLAVCVSTVPLGVSQVTTPLTSVSTESGRVAVHVRVSADPGVTFGGVANSTVAMGTAQQTKSISYDNTSLSISAHPHTHVHQWYIVSQDYEVM